MRLLGEISAVFIYYEIMKDGEYMQVMLEVSSQEIERLHELVGIPNEPFPPEFVDEAEVAMAIHTLIEVA